MPLSSKLTSREKQDRKNNNSLIKYIKQSCLAIIPIAPFNITMTQYNLNLNYFTLNVETLAFPAVKASFSIKFEHIFRYFDKEPHVILIHFELGEISLFLLPPLNCIKIIFSFQFHHRTQHPVSIFLASAENHILLGFFKDLGCLCLTIFNNQVFIYPFLTCY